MAILSIEQLQIGVVPVANGNNSLPAAAQTPSIYFIATNDTNATVTAAGYLNAIQQSTTDNFIFSNTQMALVYTTDGGGAVGGCSWYQIAVAAGVVTLVAADNNIVGNLNVTGNIVAGGSITATAGPIFSGSTITATTSFISTTGNFVATAGNFTAGNSATPNAGNFQSFPAASGGANDKFVFAAVTSGGNFTTTFSNRAVGQSTTVGFTDPVNAVGSLLIGATATPFVNGNFPVNSGTAGLMVDSGVAANTLLAGGFATPDTNANVIRFDVTCGQAALAAGGHVALITSSGTKQYKIVNLWINSGGTNFSGGGGDRLGQVSDGTTVYSVIPAATMQTLVNAGWGIGAALPFPAAAAINTSTVAGANLFFAYSGGTTDYTAGSVVVSGVAVRVA